MTFTPANITGSILDFLDGVQSARVTGTRLEGGVSDGDDARLGGLDVQYSSTKTTPEPVVATGTYDIVIERLAGGQPFKKRTFTAPIDGDTSWGELLAFDGTGYEYTPDELARLVAVEQAIENGLPTPGPSYTDHGNVTGTLTIAADDGTHALALTGDLAVTLTGSNGDGVIIDASGSFALTVASIEVTDLTVPAVFLKSKGAWKWLNGPADAGTGPVDPDPTDTTAPTAPSLSVDNTSQTQLVATISGGTDAVGVTQYRSRIDGGSWVTGSPKTFAGLTAGTSHTIDAQAGDAAGNWSTSTSQTVSTAAPAPSTTYPTESMVDSPIYALDLDDAPGTTTVSQTGSGSYAASSASGVTFGATGMAGFDSAVDLGTGSITIPGGVTNGLAAMSVMFVAKISGINGYGNLLFGFHDGTTPTSLQISTGRHARGSLNGTLTPQGAATIEDDVQHFFAMTYDGTTMKVYVDGTLDSSASFSGTVPPGGYQLGYAGLGPAKMNGLRIFNTALSGARIAALAATT